ncbi:hypothetical protein [Janibacter sp. GS2]|uniref:hypothetical protein n=1 Tax=Janibacter sp. GS2 TaxID=3442646 RepID=UPI003EC0361B
MSATDTELGQVLSVEVEEAGGNALGHHEPGVTTIQLDDASDFPELGGQARVGQTVVDIAAADPDGDTLTLATGLPQEVEDGDRVFVHPSAPTTWAQVMVDPEEGALLVEVPFGIKAFTGLAEGDLVRFADDGTGALRVVEVVGGNPTLNASYIDNAEELVLENERMLGEVLAENTQAITTAEGRLTTAEGQISDAFGEIDLLPNEAYVDAARQQAIAAAAIDAQAKADAAEAAAAQAAATDAQTKADNAAAAAQQAAQDYADAVAAGEGSGALAAAKTYAEQKAQEARVAAEAAAALDATSKADAALVAAKADATSKAAEAMTKATAALTAAQAAQASADGAIRTYYDTDPPWANGSSQPDDVLGDMWFELGTGQARRWNGTTWQVIEDESIGQALAAAQNAQTTADGKITAYYQPTEPLEGDEGDLWFDTDDDSKLRHRVGSSWVVLLDAAALADAARAAAEQAAAADATAKAEAAESRAAATAAADAQTKADAAQVAAEAAAQTYADSVAAGESSGALAAAKTYAEQRAQEARVAAEAAAALDATAKKEAAEATAAADASAKADAALQRAQREAASRGTDLVTNGTGYMGDNTNFSSFTFDPEGPVGTSGSFVSAQPYGSENNDELIPVDPSKSYVASIKMRNADPEAAPSNRSYVGLWPQDAFGQGISPQHYTYDPDTVSELAQPLAVGDTEVHLTALQGDWAHTPAYTYIGFWNYTDPGGRVWPVGTYTRDYAKFASISGNTVTLDTPYAGPSRPAGTPISRNFPGSNYMYFVSTSNTITSEWQTFKSTRIYGGIHDGRSSGTGAAVSAFPPGCANVKIKTIRNSGTTSRIAYAGVSLSDASAAQRSADEAKADAIAEAQAALDAAKADASSKADAAEQTAKAHATTMVNGLSKAVESTAMPGTTTMPKDSVWRVLDASGKYKAIFVQTASPSGSAWAARPITSEVIDNLDVGKLTSDSATLNSAVVNLFAARLANIIQANIGNLTVTEGASLNSVVAEQIAADTASFLELTVSQILAGDIQAAWSIGTDGVIYAGDPEGSHVRITRDGVRLFVLGPNGAPYEATAMAVNEATGMPEIFFGVMGADGTRLGGIASDGSVSGTGGSFTKDLRVKGLLVVGQAGGSAEQGWMDRLPRGLMNSAASSTSTGVKPSGTEAPYVRLRTQLKKGRTYRVVGVLSGKLGSVNGVLRGNVRYRLGSAQPGISSNELWAPTTGGQIYNSTVAADLQVEGLFWVDTDTEVNWVLTYRGLNGATAQAIKGRLYCEDIGPRNAPEGGEGDDVTPPTLYQSTWRATESRMFDKTGAAMAGRDGDVDQWFYFGTPTDFQSVALLYGGGVVESTDSLEFGKTHAQALSGATLHKSEIYLRNKIWFGGTISGAVTLSSLSSSSLPSSKSIDGGLWVEGVAEGEGIWIEVPTAWFTNGANRGICMGDKDGKALDGAGVLTDLDSGSFHGIDDIDPSLIRHTYSR